MILTSPVEHYLDDFLKVLLVGDLKNTSPESGKKASNEDTGPEFLFAQLKPEGANCKCGNMVK